VTVYIDSDAVLRYRILTYTQQDGTVLDPLDHYTLHMGRGTELDALARKFGLERTHAQEVVTTTPQPQPHEVTATWLGGEHTQQGERLLPEEAQLVDLLRKLREQGFTLCLQQYDWSIQRTSAHVNVHIVGVKSPEWSDK
jgi:hypothetical protein